MNDIIKCPCCDRSTNTFLSLDDKRLSKFIHYSDEYYNGLLQSWMPTLVPQLNKCDSCSHIFYKNIPTSAQLSAMYTGAIRKNKIDPARPPSKKMIATMSNLYAIVNKDKPILLDYGAGYGRWAEAAVIVGFEVVAYEPHLSRTQSSSNYTLVVAQQDLHNYTFDIIWLEQVLEHTTSPKKTLEDIWEIMNSETILRLSVPNIWRSKEGKNIWKDWPYNGKYSHTLAPYQHLQGFSQKSLLTLLQNTKYTYFFNHRLFVSNFGYIVRLFVGRFIPKLSTTTLWMKK
jgi:2-polyprenyl-3-methyl-5-hydroxy-6-metoxy-1,4-benzoquinol methylase